MKNKSLITAAAHNFTDTVSSILVCVCVRARMGGGNLVPGISYNIQLLDLLTALLTDTLTD